MKKSASKLIAFEAQSLTTLSKNIPEDFDRLINKILNLKGRVILSGIGKSGYIARKIAASLASTGTAALYIHPAEASHGDLGMITEDDVVILLSNSGETKEIFDIINYCKRFSIEIAGITMKTKSSLALASNYLLNLPLTPESSLISAPTTSSLMMLALGDALMMSIYEARGFTADDFKIFHPGGKIGANLLKVSELMHKGNDLPIINLNTKTSDAILTITKYRLGCVVVVDDNQVVGIITDGDLRRHMSDDILTMNIADIMSTNPKSIAPNILASEALSIMNKDSSPITSLLVLEGGKLEGIIHLHDILKAGIK
jgi:arabinose-5-phosphate isomerase